MSDAALFTPLTLRSVTTRNRLWASPMCQYSVEHRDGVPTDWHMVHLGSIARRGAGLVMAEATTVVPEGRISAWDLGVWNDTQPDDAGGWQTLAPSPVAFQGYAAPREMTVDEIEDVVAAFGDAARRSVQAGFDVVEVHAAHGYLLHQFLSPLANERTDAYGGSLENRARLTLQVIRERSGVPVVAVGQITEAEQAESIVSSGTVDAVMAGRQFLRGKWPV